MNQNKMSGKDYIACGIFSALCMVAMLIGAVMNMNGYTAVFYSTFVALFIGILYIIVCTKVPKTGAILIFGIIPCIYFFTSGVLEGIIGVVGVVVISLICEVILKKERNIKRIYISGAVYSLYLSVVGLAENFIATDTYCNNALEHGINPTIVEQMRTLYNIKPLWPGVIAATVVTMFFGMLIGRKLMDKHLKKAGII